MSDSQAANQGGDGCCEGGLVVRRVALARLKAGDIGVIQDKRLDDDERAMLRAMGLACNATVKLCRVGEPCIVSVLSGDASQGRLGGECCRIGLARSLAERIVVEVMSPRVLS